MILMYHHVCPLDRIPVRQIDQEGWRYTLSPGLLNRQLDYLKARRYRFISFSEYVERLPQIAKGRELLTTVTFDDGWLDNFSYALPILSQKRIPATFFVVSGRMERISSDRRMSAEQLRLLSNSGMTIGAHTRSHPNLTEVSGAELDQELRGSREDLENILQRPVRFFAYPGGQFNLRIVKATQEAGYDAACSVISWATNSEKSRYWLYREVFSDSMDRMSDRLRLNRLARSVLSFRADRWLRSMLRS